MRNEREREQAGKREDERGTGRESSKEKSQRETALSV